MIKAIEVLNPLKSKRSVDITKLDFLSPIFRLYLNYYNTNPVFKNESVYVKAKDYTYSISWEVDIPSCPFLSTDGDEEFYCFDLQTIIKKTKYPSDWKDNHLFIFATSNASQFYIGNGIQNKDQVFIDRDYNRKCKMIALNIFDFFSKLHLKKSKLFLNSINLNESDLYKKWNEEFYRA